LIDIPHTNPQPTRQHNAARENCLITKCYDKWLLLGYCDNSDNYRWNDDHDSCNDNDCRRNNDDGRYASSFCALL